MTFELVQRLSVRLVTIGAAVALMEGNMVGGGCNWLVDLTIPQNTLTHRAYGRVPYLSHFSMVSGAWYWGAYCVVIGVYRRMMRAYRADTGKVVLTDIVGFFQYGLTFWL